MSRLRTHNRRRARLYSRQVAVTVQRNRRLRIIKRSQKAFRRMARQIVAMRPVFEAVAAQLRRLQSTDFFDKVRT